MASYERIASKVVRGTIRRVPWITLVVSPMSSRENGISLMVRTKNEEWADLSILSAKDFADEIVVVDSSTDDTPNRIQRVASEEGLNLKLIRHPDRTNTPMGDGKHYTEVCNIALQNTHFRWIFKWDGDFIARTSGQFDIARLRERLLDLHRGKNHYRAHYMVYLTFANLDGDLFHTLDRNVLPSQEAFLCTYYRRLVYKNIGKFEVMKKPFFYRPLIIREPYLFHLRSVKSARRLLYRRFWTAWRETNDYVRFPTLQDYITYRIRRDWKTKDMNETARLNLMQLCKRLIPFNKAKYGDYPELLREQVRNPKYKLIYRRGKIVGRNDVGIFET